MEPFRVSEESQLAGCAPTAARQIASCSFSFSWVGLFKKPTEFFGLSESKVRPTVWPCLVRMCGDGDAGRVRDSTQSAVPKVRRAVGPGPPGTLNCPARHSYGLVGTK